MALESWHCLLCCGVFLWAAYGMIPEPQNLRVHSVMLDSVLHWDPPNFHKGNVTYRIQLRRDYITTFTDLCNRTDITKWNISDLPIYSSSILRVRTEFENNHSNWVNITFIPYEDTKFGPPSIQVEASQPGALNVQITDPCFTHNGRRDSLKDLYSPVIYRIKIWKKDYSNKEHIQMNTTLTYKLISDLDPGTTYCLKAQTLNEEFNKSGEWSETSCVKTTKATYTGINPVLLILTILLLLISFPCCFLVFCIYRQIRYAFFPSFTLPQHFKEFLSNPSYNAQFLAFQIQEDYAYEKITVLSEELKNDGKESREKLSNAKQQLRISQEETV